MVSVFKRTSLFHLAVANVVVTCSLNHRGRRRRRRRTPVARSDAFPTFDLFPLSLKVVQKFVVLQKLFKVSIFISWLKKVSCFRLLNHS
jgi:hypothetical protein